MGTERELYTIVIERKPGQTTQVGGDCFIHGTGKVTAVDDTTITLKIGGSFVCITPASGDER